MTRATPINTLELAILSNKRINMVEASDSLALPVA
jgi:hypothetical protein